MLNLNDAAEQSKGSRVLPPMSKVLVRLTIQTPTADSVGSSPELTRRAIGLEQLSTTLEVVTGSFTGAYFYHNFNIAGASTDGHYKAIDISMRHIRALVEAARGVSPKDASPHATQCRMLQSWSELHGLIFPVQVDCKESEKGYINNIMKSVITVDDADYQTLLQGGEIITDKPIPTPKAQGQNTQTPKAPPAYAAPQIQVPLSQTYQAPPAPAKAPVNTPPWAMGAHATPSSFPPPPMQTPMPFVPEVPGYMQDIPFDGASF